MIGSYTDAKTALLIDSKLCTRPKGWRCIRPGSRTVYLSPEKVIYKVEHDDAHSWQNYAEVRNAKRLSKRKTLPPNIKIPKTNLYTVRHNEEKYPIIAMEYVKGRHGPECKYKKPEFDEKILDFYDKLEQETRVGDLFSSNVKRVGGDTWLIDLGYDLEY